jgi:hypothetical protein
MKKFIVISLVLLMIAGFAITSSAEELVVGRKHILVGELTVEVVGVNLVVTYTITDPEWELGDTHLYVGTVAPTKSAPGRFPYGPEDVVEEGKYEIALDGFTGTLFIAAQAEIGMIDEFGVPVLDENDEQIKETTWAKGDECIPPCKNWAMYFTFEVVVTP